MDTMKTAPQSETQFRHFNYLTKVLNKKDDFRFKNLKQMAALSRKYKRLGTGLINVDFGLANKFLFKALFVEDVANARGTTLKSKSNKT